METGKEIIFNPATYVLFAAALCADSIATARGALGDPELEGNFIVAWFMARFGGGQWILPFIWLAVAVSIGFIFWKKRRFLSLFWLNSFAVGHAIGFSTWTKYNRIAPLYEGEFSNEQILLGNILISILVGSILAWIQPCFSKKD